MKYLLLALLLLISFNSLAQDTTKIELCYSYTDCQVKDSTVEAIYNSRCIKVECGYIVENDYGLVLFLNKDQKPFAKSIVVWYYKKQKQ